MSDKEIVIGLLARLPEDVTLRDIARDIELLDGLRIARGQAHRGEGIPIEEAYKLVEVWAGE